MCKTVSIQPCFVSFEEQSGNASFCQLVIIEQLRANGLYDMP